jgi:hypothetical protein
MVLGYCLRFNHYLPPTFHVPKFRFCFCFAVFLRQCPNICIVVNIDSWILKQKHRCQLKYDGTRAETRFRLSAKRTSPFKSAGVSVHSTTGSRGVRISGSNTPRSEVVWRVLATHSISQFPLHFPTRASQWAITFQLESTINQLWCMSCTTKCQISVREWRIKLQLCWKTYQRVVRHYAVVCTIWQTRMEGLTTEMPEREMRIAFLCMLTVAPFEPHYCCGRKKNRTARLCFVSVKYRRF